MIIVKTWCENTKEVVDYLKFNNYGLNIKRIFNTNYYICFKQTELKPIKLKDVKVIFDL